MQWTNKVCKKYVDLSTESPTWDPRNKKMWNKNPLRRRRMKMQSVHLHFKHPIISSTFAVELFSRVYHPQDTRDNGPQKKIWPWKLIRSTQNVGVFKMQIRRLHFYSPTPLFFFSLQVYWAGPMLAAPTAAFGFSFLNWNGGIRLQNRDDRKNNNEDVEDKAELTRLNSDAWTTE